MPRILLELKRLIIKENINREEKDMSAILKFIKNKKRTNPIKTIVSIKIIIIACIEAIR